jgi:hypothetical protein
VKLPKDWIRERKINAAQGCWCVAVVKDIQLIGAPGAGKTVLAKRIPIYSTVYDIASRLVFLPYHSARELGQYGEFHLSKEDRC